MNWIKIHWKKSLNEDLWNHEDVYFYAFTKGKKLLYIGIAYYQDVVHEVRQTLSSFETASDEVNIWLGYVDYSFQKISQQIILETESALINIHQPEWNTQHKATFYTRNNFRITSKGCEGIPHKIISANDALVIY